MERPVGLSIVGLVAVLGGVLQALGALGLVWLGSFAVFISPTGALGMVLLGAFDFPLWTTLLLLPLGALSAACGLGLLGLRPWSRALAMVLYALNLLAAITSLVVTGVGVTMAFVALLSIAVLAYLFTPTVRSAFMGGAAPRSPEIPRPA